MSFSSDIKAELTKIRTADCCAFAQCYGMLVFSRSFSKDEVSLSVSSLDTAKCFSSLMHRTFDCRVVVEEKGEKRKMGHRQPYTKLVIEKIEA